NLDDGVTFDIKNVTKIMDEMEYQGIRLSLEACMSGMTTAIKIDISTGDVITPRAIEYNYRLMLEEKSIKLWSYNLETVLAEKIQTILSRGVLNTRMRDFYDVYLLKILYDKNIDKDILKKAFGETCNYRGTDNLIEDGINVLKLIENNQEMITLWKRYQQKYEYARDIKFENIMDVLKKIILEL
ncbi:MAG TPA: nucleotidyl transferase AbiEii/AbiGii toxin family protein, partial [Eubacterium sp.]|nr:nucleotidyl transferase AbiEii/AbiGii toxin family protein [Eubacterium sp.]